MRRMKDSLFAVLLMLTMFCASAYAVPRPDAPVEPTNVVPVIREIKNPTFSQPAFVLLKGNLFVSLELPAPGKVTSVALMPFDAPQSVTSVPVAVNFTTAGTREFKVALPASIVPGMYDLCVDFTYSGYSSRDCQKHAVAVKKSFDTPLKIVQLTDYHMGDPRALKQFPGVDIKKVRIAALEETNRQNPDFVIFTGDINAYPQTYEEDYPATVEELVANLHVPMITVPGNHDLYSWVNDKGKVAMDGNSFWDAYFGQKHRVLDYGPYRFIFFNSYDWAPVVRSQNMQYSLRTGKASTYNGVLSEIEFAWIEAALKGAGSRIPILAAHHGPREIESNPVQWCKTCARKEQLLALMKKYKVAYYFYGHIHANLEYAEGGTQYFATISTGSDVSPGKLWGLRVISVSRDRKITTNVVQLFDAPPMLGK